MTENIGAIITTTGEETEAECINSARRNKIKEIRIIRNVAPFSAAVNQGVQQCKTNYVMHIASDMLIHDNAIEIVEKTIKKHRPDLIIFPLMDWLMGEMLGLAVYNKKCFKRLGGLNPTSVVMETDYIKDLINSGGIYVLSDEIIGEHKCRKEPIELFKMFFRGGIKNWLRLDWWSVLDTTKRLILKLREHGPLATVALLGHVLGIAAPILNLRQLSKKPTNYK